MDDCCKMELFQKAKDGDLAARHALYEQYQHLPKRAATDFLKRHQRFSSQYDDFLSQAMLILYTVLMDYDPSRGDMTGFYSARIMYGLMDFSYGLAHSGIRVPGYIAKNKDKSQRICFHNIGDEEYLGDDGEPIQFLETIPEDEEEEVTRVPRRFEDLTNNQRATVIKIAKNAIQDDLQYQIFINYFGFMHCKSKSVAQVSQLLHISQAAVNKSLAGIITRCKNRASKTCPQCHRKFYSFHATYCSQICQSRYLTARADENAQVKSTCRACGKEFAHTKRKSGKYCSLECSIKGRSGQSHTPKIRPTLTCQRPECQKEFAQRSRGSKIPKYCSSDCYHKDKWRVRRTTRPLVTCRNPLCGKQFSLREGGVKNSTYWSLQCCMEHRRKGAAPQPRSRSRKDGLLATCQYPACGKQFPMRYGGLKHSKFCSAECAMNDLKERGRPHQAKPVRMIVCQTCGKKFPKRRGTKEPKYCSCACYQAAPKASNKLICRNPQCGQKFSKRGGGAKRNHYCSLPCATSHRKQRTDARLAAAIRRNGTLRVAV